MQTTGDFIGVIIEFTAACSYGHDDFSCRHTLFRVNTGRNTAAIVLYGDRLSLWIVTTMSLQ